MALPAIMRRLFAGDGYGPLLKDDIVSKHISIQDWSNAFDYQPATVVRGPDGLLYWSLAQSGPGTGAGAVNPATDSGVYWGSLPMKTPSLGDSGDALATTGWVKALVVVPIFLDPNGSDSNDGLTASTPVQTFARAAQVAGALPANLAVLKVAAGTYTGDLSIRTQNLRFELAGNVTFNGSINVEASYIEVFGSGAFSIACSDKAHAVRVVGSSTVDFKCDVNVNVQNVNIVFLSLYTSRLYFLNPVSIVANTVARVFELQQTYCEFFGTLSISGSDVGSVVNATSNSIVLFDTGINVSDVVTYECLRFEGCSICRIDTPSGVTSNIRGGSSAYASILVYGNSYMLLAGAGDCNIYHKGLSGGGCIIAQESAIISNANLKLKATACVGFIFSTNTSNVRLDSGSCDFSGPATDGTVCCNFVSMMTIMAGVTLTGSSTGPRYNVSWNSTIFTQGGGPNRIPGSADGIVFSNLYGLYG